MCASDSGTDSVELSAARSRAKAADEALDAFLKLAEFFCIAAAGGLQVHCCFVRTDSHNHALSDQFPSPALPGFGAQHTVVLLRRARVCEGLRAKNVPKAGVWTPAGGGAAGPAATGGAAAGPARIREQEGGQGGGASARDAGRA